MASAQVLPNSKKLGHLEAGKKKLEEFRKKKAEGRAKKGASTGQLIPAEADQYEKASQKYEPVRDGAQSAIDTDSHASGIADESKAVNSSQSTEIHSSGRTHTPVLVDSNHASYSESVQKEVPKLYESSIFPELVNGYYDKWKGSSERSHEKDTKTRPSGGSAPDQFDTSNPVKANPNLDMNISNSSFLSFFKAPPDEDRNPSDVQMSQPQTSFANSVSTSENTESISGPSTSANTSGLCNEPSTGVELSHHGSLYKNNATDFGMRGGKIADSIDHNLNVDSVHWQASETSYKDSSLAYKGTRYEYPFGSTGFGTSSTQSRPSFLDILGVSRVPPYVPYGEPAKANMTGSFDISKVQSTGSSLSSPARHFAEFNTTDQSLKTMTPDFKSHKELSMDTLVSSNDGKLLQPPCDHHAQRDHQLFTSGKDEGFAALEQHIEDLTQEKFSLQRALETSRTLAESLATENSSLTDSYNHQGKIVSQLKSDMERLQEEIKAQLLALESLRSESMNAQLEFNAADERAKMLASEVISLEEKGMSGGSRPSDTDIGPSEEGRKRRKQVSHTFRWSEEMGDFLIQFMADQISSGLRGHNYAAAAKAVNEKFEEHVSESQVYNHLRTWRAKWNRILNVRKLSGCVVWDAETRTLRMPDEEYKVYIKANRLDKPYLNKPIHMYDEMAIVFGDEVATGKRAKDGRVPGGLGNEADVDEFVDEGDGNDVDSLNQGRRSGDQAQSMSISQGSRGKGKRTNPHLQIMENFAGSLGSIASHLREVKADEEKLLDDCLEALQGMIDTEFEGVIFTTKVVNTAYDFLVEHPSIARGFLKRKNEMRACWLFQFVQSKQMG